MPASEPVIVLVTASKMPKPDPESWLLVRALEGLGIPTAIRVWDEPYDWSRVALVVSRTPWDYFDREHEFLRWAREVSAVTRLENPLEVLNWNHHKSYLLALARSGVATVPTVIVGRGAGPDEQQAALAAHSELVVKPAVSGGAKGALRARGEDPVAAEHLRVMVQKQDALVQPFQPAIGAGEASLVFFDGRFSHAVCKHPARGDYRVHERFGGAVVAHDPSPAELELAGLALEVAPGRTAYARIDLVGSPAGPLLMEAELIEPELFLARDPGAAGRFARCLAERAGAGPAASAYSSRS